MLPDVNVLVSAYRDDAPEHGSCRAWLESVLHAREAFGISNLVLSGFLHIVTHRRIFARPSPLDEALAFVDVVHGQPQLRACSSRRAALGYLHESLPGSGSDRKPDSRCVLRRTRYRERLRVDHA